MNKKSFFLLLSFFICSVQISSAADVAFSSASISELIGKSTCSLPPDSRIGMFRLPLSDVQGHALEYRKKGNFETVFLLRGIKEPDECGEIISVLKLQRHKKSETIEFDCFVKGDKERQKRIIGIADNQKGKFRYAIARLAWSVNFDTQVFEPINNKIVICDTRGYAE
ncbi:MAG: hypothetical protein HYS21_03480 [Deltaproteobacteria bacterium]|nr:hypothetical protein [Deltaproteobacteria bacterium]